MFTEKSRTKRLTDPSQAALTPSNVEIERMLHTGDTDSIEYHVLWGRGSIFYNRTAQNVKTKAFLKTLEEYETAITTFLTACVEGDQSTVQHLLNYRKVA